MRWCRITDYIHQERSAFPRKVLPLTQMIYLSLLTCSKECIQCSHLPSPWGNESPGRNRSPTNQFIHSLHPNSLHLTHSLVLSNCRESMENGESVSYLVSRIVARHVALAAVDAHVLKREEKRERDQHSKIKDQTDVIDNGDLLLLIIESDVITNAREGASHNLLKTIMLRKISISDVNQKYSLFWLIFQYETKKWSECQKFRQWTHIDSGNCLSGGVTRSASKLRLIYLKR